MNKAFDRSCSTFVGVIAMIMLATMFSAAQSFPQDANPALVNGQRYLPLVVETNYEAATPSAIASGQAGIGEQEPASVLAWHHNEVLGSASEPAPGLGDSTPADNPELGSPFPMAANPSR